MSNKELFIDTLAHIELDPERWIQETWGYVMIDPREHGIDFETELDGKWDEVAAIVASHSSTMCGTAMCMAGWAATLGGEELVYTTTWSQRGSVSLNAETVKSGEAISTAADRLLGIEDHFIQINDYWHDLYCASNSLDDLYEISAALLDVDLDDLRAQVTERVSELAAKRHAASVS